MPHLNDPYEVQLLKGNAILCHGFFGWKCNKVGSTGITDLWMGNWGYYLEGSELHEINWWRGPPCSVYPIFFTQFYGDEKRTVQVIQSYHSDLWVWVSARGSNCWRGTPWMSFLLFHRVFVGTNFKIQIFDHLGRFFPPRIPDFTWKTNMTGWKMHLALKMSFPMEN